MLRSSTRPITPTGNWPAGLQTSRQGLVLLFNPDTGWWDTINPLRSWQTGDPELGTTVAQFADKGLPVVLVLNWARQVDVQDTGFAEAAAQTAYQDEVLAWYAGTASLALAEFPGHGGKSLSIFRQKRGDADKFAGADEPWYQVAAPDASGELGLFDSISEGVGEGWYYSEMGGGKTKRTTVYSGSRPALTDDNSTVHDGDGVISTVFNGGFEQGTSNLDSISRLGREVPGWSLGVSGTPLGISQIATGQGGNHYLTLSAGQSISHSPLVVPELGVLRLDVHALGTGGTVEVSLSPLAGEGRTSLGSVQLGDGQTGFETFVFQVPDSFRSTPAVLTISAGAGASAQVDNVFFRALVPGPEVPGPSPAAEVAALAPQPAGSGAPPIGRNGGAGRTTFGPVPPFVTGAQFTFEGATGSERPVIVLTGENFLQDRADPQVPPGPDGNVTGSQLGDLSVTFTEVGPKGRTFVASLLPTSSALEVHAVVPQSVVLGLCEVRLVRTLRLSVLKTAGGVGSRTVTVVSNPVRITPPGGYLFGALSALDEVLVVNQSTQDLVARVPLGILDPQNPERTFVAPRAVAATSDRTRAYVTLAGGAGVAVVDAVAFQEIDAVPDQEDLPGDTPDVKRAKEATRGINAIPLPRGSHPFGIAMNATSTRAYVSDEQCGKIYVLDTSPYSATYNTLLGTIDVGTARLGLRGLDLSANGYYLYVAAPGQLLMGEGSGEGRILVVELPTWYGEDVDAPLGRLAYTIGGLGEPYGVTATTDPDVVAFADRSADRAGVGLITMKHPAKLTQPPTFSVEYADLTELGRQSDTKTFAVANAEAVAVTADLQYAFVTGFNKFVPRIPWHDPYVDPTEPCGGNVGIIRLNRDSKGVFHPELVAATRPIPVSFPDNLVLSPDGKYLYAAYRGQVDAVFVFDVSRMIQVAGDDVLASQCCVGWHCWLVQQCSGVWLVGRSPFRMAIFPLPTG